MRLRVFLPVLLLLACGRETAEEPARIVTERATPPPTVVEVQMGTAEEGGVVPEAARTDDFRPGQTIAITAKLRGMEGWPVTVNWYGPGGLAAGTDTATVGADGVVAFHKSDTAAWIPGDYRVTLSSGMATLASEQFHILGSEAAVDPSR